ncbi:MAG: ATP-binding cassette domain-containing protein [Pseudomonadota bacterium]
MSAEAAITAGDLRLAFGEGASEVVALDGVDITLRRGELTLLMGPSGSGKSSLLSVLSGLVRPDAGRLEAMGRDVTVMNDRQRTGFRRDHCGFVFQSVTLFPALTAEQQIAMPLEYLGYDRSKARAIARERLEEVGLGARRGHRPGQMSGGENQRVAIARMLAKSPDLIFCDEPTSALDGENGALVANLLKEASRSYSAMVFCVTHDHRLEPHADRVIDIADAQIVSERPGGAVS